MKKYIVFVAFLALASCSQSTFAPQPAVSNGQLLFIGANQSDCRNQLGSLETKASECALISSTKFEGESLKIIVDQKAFCSSKFTLTSKIVGNTITLKSQDTSTVASRCTCNYDLSYSFSGIKPGLYKIDYDGNVYNNDPCKTSTTVTK